jgi:hypothetical protein
MRPRNYIPLLGEIPFAAAVIALRDQTTKRKVPFSSKFRNFIRTRIMGGAQETSDEINYPPYHASCVMSWHWVFMSLLRQQEPRLLLSSNYLSLFNRYLS